MRMDSAPEVPSPLVTSELLSAHVKKSVMFAGKVVSAMQNKLLLDGGDGGRQVAVSRAVPPTVQIDPGMTVLVRGFVNEDLSIAESTSFPATILGDNFGKFIDSHITLRYPNSSFPWYFVINHVRFSPCIADADLSLSNQSVSLSSHPSYSSIFTN